MLIGLLDTCSRIILPVVSDFILGKRATTSSPRRQMSWSSQYRPSAHSSQSFSIISLHLMPQSSQSYWISICFTPSAPSGNSAISSWQAWQTVGASSLYGHLLQVSLASLFFFQFFIISVISLFACLVLKSMSSDDMHSNLFSMELAMHNKHFDS